MCLAELREGGPLADHLGQVLKASKRAALLTRQLLAFGRRQVLQPVGLSLNQVLVESGSLTQPSVAAAFRCMANRFDYEGMLELLR
jgi:hypothetical protein